MRNISLVGQSTRYQMKKLLSVSTDTCIPRNDYSKWTSIHSNLDCSSLWKESLIRIKDSPTDIKDPLDILIKSELMNKLRGYKLQDKHKTMDLSSVECISLSNCIELLLNTQFKCFYCLRECCVIYQNRRDLTQWTLDRIDNTMGHIYTNVVISCLGCNIQRRNKPSHKFKDTKQLVLIKKEHADDLYGDI